MISWITISWIIKISWMRWISSREVKSMLNGDYLAQ